MILFSDPMKPVDGCSLVILGKVAPSHQTAIIWVWLKRMYYYCSARSDRLSLKWRCGVFDANLKQPTGSRHSKPPTSDHFNCPLVISGVISVMITHFCTSACWYQFAVVCLDARRHVTRHVTLLQQYVTTPNRLAGLANINWTNNKFSLWLHCCNILLQCFSAPVE